MVLGEVFAVFHPIGPDALSAVEWVAGDGGEPRLRETSMAQWRQLEAHSVGGGLDGGNTGLARGVERIGAAGALSEVEGARSSAASGMPSPSLFKQSSSAMCCEESLHFVMVADHVEIEQPAISREDEACGKSMPAFIESFPERSEPLPRWACGLPKESRTASISSPMPFRSGFVKARKAASKSGSNLTSNRVLDVSGESAGFAGLDGFLRFGMKGRCDRGDFVVAEAVLRQREIRRRNFHRTERHNPTITHDPDFLPIERLLQQGWQVRASFRGCQRLHGFHTRRNRNQSKSSLRHTHHDAVEAFGEGGAEGVDDGAGGAGVGDVRMP